MSVIKSNYVDYERVKKTFKEFIKALVWESIDIDEGLYEDEVNKDIDRFCLLKYDETISEINKKVSDFIKRSRPRYHVTLTCGEKDESFSTNTFSVALSKVIKFYREEENPNVAIFDRFEDRYCFVDVK